MLLLHLHQPPAERVQQRKGKFLMGEYGKAEIQDQNPSDFADGGTAVVAFGLQNPARIELVLRAWGLLYQRELRGWDQTSLPAEYWYDGRKKRMCRYDDPICHDLLEMLIPLAAAIQRRQCEVVALRKRGRGIRDIARELEMPVPTVAKMLEESA